jgi:hypothetical protein
MAEEVYDKKNIEHIFAANKNWAKMMTKSDKVMKENEVEKTSYFSSHWHCVCIQCALLGKSFFVSLNHRFPPGTAQRLILLSKLERTRAQRAATYRITSPSRRASKTANISGSVRKFQI